MLTLNAYRNKSKLKVENSNSTAALNMRINQMVELKDNGRFIAALKLKGYIEALCDQQLMTLADANNWLQIIESKYQGVN